MKRQTKIIVHFSMASIVALSTLAKAGSMTDTNGMQITRKSAVPSSKKRSNIATSKG